jgi:hypothetical protein
MHQEHDAAYKPPQRNLSERRALQVAQAAARLYAEFPSREGNLSQVALLDWQRLAPYVSKALAKRIRAEWMAVGNWQGGYYKTELLPGAYLQREGTGVEKAMVILQKTRFSPDGHNLSFDVTYSIRLQLVGGRWVVSYIQSTG